MNELNTSMYMTSNCKRSKNETNKETVTFHYKI